MGAIERVFRGRRGGQERPATAIVAGLWRNGEQGVWYDPSDLSTMFQDAAGTTPCYQPGQGQVDPPVGRILDKSGRGNHATQPTTTCRPTLSARYNLLTATEFANGLTDVPSRGGLVSATALAGYAGAIAFGHNGATSSYAYKNDIGSYPLATVSVVVQMDDGNAPMFGTGATTSNTDFALVVRNVAISPSTYLVTPLPNGCYRVSGSQVATAGSSAVGVVKYNSNSPRTFKVTAFDLRPASDGVGLPTYQRVVDANTYDTAGFPLYLKPDGVDDWLQTAAVDFSGTDKLFVSTAFRKLSDAARGMLYELSSDLNVNAGAFAMEAPDAASAASLRIRSNGTTQATASAASLPAPGSFVTVHSSAISEPLTSLRVNGAPVVSSTSAQGSGNFGNYPLYIGRRGGASIPFNGRLYGLLIRGAATPAATIAKVERHLNSKARAY